MSTLRRALVAATALALGVSGALLVAAPAAALGCIVSSTADDGTDGTLRFAVETDGCSVVTFDSSFNVARTITLDGATLGDIEISESKMIVGPGSGLLTVTRGSDPTDYNMFEVDASNVADITISGLTLTGADDALVGVGSAFQSLDDETRHLSFTDVTFSHQNAQHGAAVDVQAGSGNVTFTDCFFLLNTADDRAGAVSVLNITGILSINDSVFEENTALHGGALSFDEVDTVNIDLTTFENNTATDSGGAIGLGMSSGYGEVTITNSLFLDNESQDGYGGAIYTDGSSNAPFTIARTTFDGNSATSDDEGGPWGGAVYVHGVDEPFTIDSSTFTRNSTSNSDPEGPSGVGTSVAVGSIDDAETSLFFIVNSTFDEDLTDASGETMIFVEVNNGTISIEYSTLVGHLPVWVGNPEPGVSTVASTIVQSGAGQPDLFNEDDPFQVQFSILSKPLDTVLITDLGGNQFSTDALLGALQNNGGLTETRMPAANSPALSRGGPTMGAPLLDQRYTGFPRIVGTLDVGAVEIPAVLPATGGSVPLWMPIVGGLVLLLGAGAVAFAAVNRRRHSQ